MGIRNRYQGKKMNRYALGSLPSPITIKTGTSFEITNYGGNLAVAVNGAWRFEFPFRTAWAGRPAANSVPAGTELQVTDYANQKFISDGTYWRPAQGRALLYEKWALLTAPLSVLTGTASGVFALAGGAPRIPAGMIAPNSKITLQADARKVGANATAIMSAYLGTTGATSDSAVVAISLSIATNMDACITAAARFGSSKTSFNSRTWLGDGATSASSGGVLTDRTSLVNTDADMFITLGISSASASDVFNLVGCTLILEA